MPAAKGSVPWNAGTSNGWTDKRGYRWLYVADGVGSMVLDVVATFKPGRFPERVFYTRRWIDPDGREFGKTGTLRIATTGKFRRLLKGYRYPFEVCE